jgi:lysophospholipase L1-like esterase
MQVVPFGSGWATAFVACPPGAAPPRAVAAPAARVLGAAVVFALGFVAYLRGSRWREWPVAALPLATVTWAILVRDDPGRVSPLLPTVALALGSGAVGYRLLRLRPRRALALAALVAGAGAAAMLVPHPGASADDVVTAPAAAPPLAVDPAYWHFLAPHQRLGFVQHSLAEVAGPADETWLVVGGSVTAGTEVDPAETYTAVAERTLRATGQRVRLVNAAVSGWHIGQIDQLLRDLGDRLPARGVVVASVLNNAAFRIVGRPDPPTTDSLLWTYWYGLGRNHLLLPGVSFFMPKPDNGDRLQRTLDRLIVREQGLGRTIVLLDETHEAQLGPTWYNAWLGRPQEAQRQVIRDVAAQHDLRLHRVDDVVAALPPAERFLDGMHLTRAGHAAVGARLAAILTREREAPRP